MSNPTQSFLTKIHQILIHPQWQKSPLALAIEQNIEGGDNDYGHSDILGTTINSEDDEEHSRYFDFTGEVNMHNPIFEIVRIFNDH